MNLQVLKRFDEYLLGDVISDDAIRPGRLRRMVDQKLVVPVLEADTPTPVPVQMDGEGLQPSAQMLVDTPILKLEEVLDRVMDTCVVQKALRMESRSTAMNIMGKWVKNHAENH